MGAGIMLLDETGAKNLHGECFFLMLISLLTFYSANP
jgi:hypothetical protein